MIFLLYIRKQQTSVCRDKDKIVISSKQENTSTSSFKDAVCRQE